MSASRNTHLAFQFNYAIIAIASLAVLLWSAWQAIQMPDLGALWTSRGIVYYAHAESGLQLGDELLRIDGLPLNDSDFPYYSWQYGDLISLEIRRGGQLETLSLPFVNSPPLLVLAMRFSLKLVALFFWGVSVALILLSSRIVRENTLFFLWCQTLGTSLALGTVTSQIWAGHLANVFIWCTAALAIHLHFIFPFAQFGRRARPLIWAVYLLAAAGSLLRLAMAVGAASPFASMIYPLLFYSWVLFGLIAVLFLLARAYRRSPSIAAKRQIGLITLSGFVAGLPILSLSVFPMVLLGAQLVPAQIALFFLIAVPIGYGYAFRKYQFIRLERYVSRSAAIIYIIGLLGIVYLFLTFAIQTLFGRELLSNPLVNLLTILLLVLIYNPLYRRLQRLVDYLFYGGWYDYPTVVSQVTTRLEQTADIDTLAGTLSASVQRTMRVEWVYLVWQEAGSGPVTVVLSEDSDGPLPVDALDPEKWDHIFTHFREKAWPTDSQTIFQRLRQEGMTPSEQQVLTHPQIRLWVPIKGLDTSLGLLLLGPKYGGELFNAEDMAMLSVVSRQASAVFQNAQLIGKLREKARENEQYQKEINRTREEERKLIARELHDQVIQQLIGFKYHLAQLEAVGEGPSPNGRHAAAIAELEEQIGTLIQTTRLLCQNLRPAALDLGLIPAVRSLTNQFERESGLEIEMRLDGDRAIPIDEEIALCLYRCAGEALTNIRKHALATQIVLELAIRPEEVTLEICDNGSGFVVPPRLGVLMEQNHFGLVGMRERVDLLEGTFEITSTPASGTSLFVSIPLIEQAVVEEVT